MNPKWMAVAGALLQTAGERFSNHGGNDWRWPAGWDEDQRRALAEAMVCDNLGKTLDQLTDNDLEEVERHVAVDFGPPDWWVMKFLGRKLIEECL